MKKKCTETVKLATSFLFLSLNNNEASGTKEEKTIFVLLNESFYVVFKSKIYALFGHSFRWNCPTSSKLKSIKMRIKLKYQHASKHQCSKHRFIVEIPSLVGFKMLIFSSYSNNLIIMITLLHWRCFNWIRERKRAEVTVISIFTH